MRDEGGGMRDEIRTVFLFIHPSSLIPHPWFKTISPNSSGR
jgi:hypothetical protein